MLWKKIAQTAELIAEETVGYPVNIMVTTEEVATEVVLNIIILDAAAE